MAKILIIDDDALIRRLIARVLGDEGHDVTVAQDGNDGLKQFRVERPALVISDILMPEKEGIETILEIRREAPSIPILAISGGDTFLDIATKLGASGSLSKPFRNAELIEVVNRLLEVQVGAPSVP
jgi:DNA-binding response OmpR family regulator